MAREPSREGHGAPASPGGSATAAGLLAVAGAGTMGTGIARVAARAGFRVLLYDVDAAQLERARQRIAEAFQREAARGRLHPEEAPEAAARVATTTDLAALAPADAVIEAVPEDLELKRRLFAELGRICRRDALLATNTSSLSVTAIARDVPRPERVIGLHFFNPVPAMRLVEVVRGALSGEEAVRRGIQLAERLGKTPVVCADTPAFIVNRVARPFYGEALRILGERVAAVDQVDRLLRAAGFPMGPFELIDLIGVDVNFAVTRSVYEAFFGEPRYRPHPIQWQLVAAGWLGRKTGRGFYIYDEEGRPAGVAWRPVPAPAAAPGDGDQDEPATLPGLSGAGAPGAGSPGPGAPPAGGGGERPAGAAPAAPARAQGGGPIPAGEPPAGSVVVVGDGPLARELAARFGARRAGPVYPQPEAALAASAPVPAGTEAVVVTWEGRDPLAPGEWEERPRLLAALERRMPPGALLLVAIQAQSCGEQARALERPGRVAGFAAVPPLGHRIELAAGPRSDPACLARAERLFRAAGLECERVLDAPGGVVPRVLAMLINEAVLALDEGVAAAAAIDRAMELGTNYPRGPLAWARMWGLGETLAVLVGLAREYGEDRYRPAPGLLRRVRAGREEF
ncbi:MAG TPA: 3-hydroxyacyl-CoA dehydrogenase NAD-binding domain-containing protein [Thermaerobacter sp.]